MSDINISNNLISSSTYIQTPIIHVKIGDYTFGKYESNKRGFAKYPNYIQSLSVTKINGQVNSYTLNLIYPINEYSDPNYFEKVFSSVSKTRKIEFSYGDASAPSYLYKNEVALITKVKSNFNLDTSSSINYTVYAVSQSTLALTGNYSFPASKTQPSRLILELLQNKYYGLQDLFTGMRNIDLVTQYNLIPGNDREVSIKKKDKISPLSYLEYLVSLMSPSVSYAKNNSVYILSFIDDTSGIFGGPYFKITEVNSNISHPEAYQLDIGYPGSNYVYNFSVDNDENYSIFYEYNNTLHPQGYVSRINADGDYEDVYAPIISSSNDQRMTTELEQTWWDKVTQYPVKASLVIKGLLRPAVLMSYVRINIILYGKKHINSGLYIVTKQVDDINGNGYQTTLNLLKISGD